MSCCRHCWPALQAGSASAATIDLAFALDESGSVGTSNYNLEKQGLATALSLVPTSGPNQYRISVVSFASSVQTLVNPTILTGANLATIQAAINSMPRNCPMIWKRFQATGHRPEVEKARPVRRPFPPELPRETVVHSPGCVCASCGTALRTIGEDVAEVLEYVPASFRVIRHVRPKLACPRCETLVQAPAPVRPIARGIAGPGLLAHILTRHFPLLGAVFTKHFAH